MVNGWIIVGVQRVPIEVERKGESEEPEWTQRCTHKDFDLEREANGEACSFSKFHYEGP